MVLNGVSTTSYNGYPVHVAECQRFDYSAKEQETSFSAKVGAARKIRPGVRSTFSVQ